METMKEKLQFMSLTETMDLPIRRRTVSLSNLSWFLRNASIRNSDHPNIAESIQIAKKIIK